MNHLSVVSPVDGEIYVERALANESLITDTIEKAERAGPSWRKRAVEERVDLVLKAVDIFVGMKEKLAEEITWQMGRPIRFAPGEINGFEERARYMAAIAPETLAAVHPKPKAGFNRFIRREPLGQVFVIAPWNYPYLTAVNAVVPALLAGNTVIIKHSAQTPLCAERFVEVFVEAGLPEGVFQFLHLDHSATEKIIAAPEIDFVAFTGSVPGGQMVERSAAGLFKGVGLELGGKDPAYVRADANIAHAVDTVIDGAFFNSGQSCCGIERAYVDEKVFDEFLAGAVEAVSAYVLGRPDEEATTLGPLVKTAAADFVRAQVREAVDAGAKAHIPSSLFDRDETGSPYLAPQLLTDVSHKMREIGRAHV